MIIGLSDFIVFRGKHVVGGIVFHKHIFQLYFAETFMCPENYFKCPESFCVEKQYVCDGIAHCQSGEDEQDCGGYTIHYVLMV